MGDRPIDLVIVEDDDKDYELLTTILTYTKEWNARIRRYADLESAIREAPGIEADLFLLDLKFPGDLSGKDFLKTLRTRGDFRPIIILTGYGGEKTAAELMRLGATDYLAKRDLTPEALRRSVRVALNEARLEREKMMLEAELREAHKIEGLMTLAGGIAHDFNNMLTSITGNVQLAILTSTQPEVRDRLLKTQQVCEQMGETVRRLYNLRPGGFRQTETLELKRVVEDALVVIRPLIEPAVRLIAEVHDAPLLIEGAEGAIRQTLEVLAINAVEAMPTGGVLRITGYRLESGKARLIPSLMDQDYAVLEVADTGRGIDPNIVGRIFDPFFSTKDRDSRRGKGLSLAVAWQHVREFNGFIDVESEPDKGSTFRLFFPIIDTEAVQPPPIPPAPEPGKSASTILIADDEPMVLEATAAMLEHLGYPTIGARNGLDALNIFERERLRIGAVILDIAMPQMDGIRAYHAIRKIDAKVPVLFITAHGAENYAARLKAEGAAAVMDKPIELMVLASTLKEALKSGVKRS